MDKRFFLALMLTAVVIVVTPLLFPSATRRTPTPIVADSTHQAGSEPVSAKASPDTPAVTATVPAQDRVVTPTAPSIAAETTVVKTSHFTYAFSSYGAAPISVVLDSYPSRRPGARSPSAELVRAKTELIRYRMALGTDTIPLDTVAFRGTESTTGGVRVLTYQARTQDHNVQIAYSFVPDSFLVRVSGAIDGAPSRSVLLVDLPRALESNEADTLEDVGHLAVSFRTSRGDVSSVSFAKLDTAKVRIEAGPLDWVAIRNKYFLVAYRSVEKHPFALLRMQGEPKIGKVTPTTHAAVVLPLSASGTAAFDIYAGPQDFQRLQRLGNDLDQVNPYGGWIHGAVQPFVTIVMRALLWMKHTTQLSYGWVLVLFGVLIRLALWPLNQRAMRTSISMQRLQPELQALQKKYKDDPKRQQEAVMGVYKDHGMSPLSPLMGCLPMLLPMPVLYALYFVFQNTIEFRGVPFLWLPDLSMRDPYYITPLLMGISMFVMSWIGLRGAPSNPQAKMMSYMMPVVLTALFLNFASGLNLYYAVQNVAALPQQWLLARERAKTGPAPVASVNGPGPTVKRRS
jgi:YidC/Oxa1 family membrane protein insertase